MSSYPCDQFAADALSICDEILKETGVEIKLNPEQVEEMLETIERSTRRMVIDHDELKGHLMGRYNFSSEYEETGYERLLIKIYKRRLGHKRSMDSKHGRFAPTPPIEAYEQ